MLFVMVLRSTPGDSMHRFLSNQDGAIAVIFAIIAIPLIALGGWGVDYLRLFHVKDFLQSRADAAALSATLETENWAQLGAPLETFVRSEAVRQYGTAGWAEEVRVSVERVAGSHTDFRVTATAEVPLAFMSIVPGIPDRTPVSAVAVARLSEIEYEYEPPELAELDPEAGDYNRVWLYCFWRDRPENDPDLPRRTQMVPIADNAGSAYIMDRSDNRPPDQLLAQEARDVERDYALGIDGREKGIWRITQVGRRPFNTPVYTETRSERSYVYRMPVCPNGSYLSLRLENVRFSRTDPRYWDSGTPPGRRWDLVRFNYYTDSVIANDVEDYLGLTMQHVNTAHSDHGRPVNMMETVLCERPRCDGPNDRVPSGKNRHNPLRETRPCEPGKYMYYGFEDRPPGLAGPNGGWEDYAWTDRDYDDIRVIIPCPVPRPVGERHVRLVG